MEVIINEDWQHWETSFYLSYNRGGKRVIIGQKDGELVEHTPEMGCSLTINPLIKLPFEMAKNFIEGIVDYASNKNIKTVNENLMLGKLSATEKHLEDMRTGFTKLLDKIIEHGNISV